MGRISQTYPLDSRTPEIGLIVLYHPVQKSNQTIRALPAIIHFISDVEQRIVDLTLFTPDGPIVKNDVQFASSWMDDRWTYRD